MLGLMQDSPLTLDSILRRGERYYPSRSVVTKTVTGVERATFADIAIQARQVGAALDQLGLSSDARVGSFAWNTARHLALYFGVPCTGRVLHTINIRYFADQVVYSINHAEDEAIFVDRSLLGLFGKYLRSIDTVKHIIVMDDGAPTRDCPTIRACCPGPRWSTAPTNSTSTAASATSGTAAALCYTTGTTGNPKGVLYSHRSIWLHANAGTSSDRRRRSPTATTSCRSCPMFHAMAWGIPYTALLAGAQLTMPGPDLIAGRPAGPDGDRAGHLRLRRPDDLDGHAAAARRARPVRADARSWPAARPCPRRLSEGWRAAIGVPIIQGWGMTETSPVGSICRSLRAEFADAGEDELADIRATAGIALVGVEMRIVDAGHAGRAALGRRGHAARSRCAARGSPGSTTAPTSRASSSPPTAGCAPATSARSRRWATCAWSTAPRTWSSPAASGSAPSTWRTRSWPTRAVAEAAVIAVPAPEVDGAPAGLRRRQAGRDADAPTSCSSSRRGRPRRWRLPDDVVFIDEVPKTSVGKFSKKTLRDKFARLPHPLTRTPRAHKPPTPV